MLRWIDTVFPRRALFQRDRRLLHLFLGRVFASVGFSIVIPFLSLYLHEKRGVAMSAVGAIFFLAALTGGLGQIVGGDWSDRYGRKRVIVLTQLLRAVVFLSMGLAVLTSASYYVFAGLTAVSSFAGRAFEPPSGAMIADIATGEQRTEYYGILRIGGNLGWALGPAMGGFLAAISYSSLFFIAAAVLLAAGGFMAIMLQETSPRHRRGRSRRPVEQMGDLEKAATQPVAPVGPTPRFRLGDLGEAFRDTMFLRHCVTCLVLYMVMSQLMSTLSVYAVEGAGISKVQLGTIYSLNGFMVVFLQFPVVRLLAPHRMTTALVVGSVLYGVGYGSMGFGGGFAALMASMFVVTMGEIVTTPASLNLVASFSNDSNRGRYMGAFGLFNSFGWSIGPLVGGVLLDLALGRPLVLWGTIGGLAFLAAQGFRDLRRRIDTAIDRAEESPAAQAATA
jgi:MFS family permease